MGCLYLEIEGQSCLVGSVDQGLMKNRQIDLLDRMTQKRARKETFIFPTATLPGIFQQIAPKKSLSQNYRLSIVIGLRVKLGMYPRKTNGDVRKLKWQHRVRNMPEKR